MDEEKIDEKMLELTDIFNELTSNAIGLSKDLIAGMDAVHQVSYAWFLGAFVMILFGNTYGWGTRTYFLTAMMVVMGIINIWRFRKLKSKYSQIYQLREELGIMKGSK